MKTCTRCRQTQPDENFYLVPATGRRWLVCNTCIREQRIERRRRQRAGEIPPRSRRSPVARALSGDTRTFGVEIEFHGDDEAVARELSARGVRCQNERYSHSVRTYWKIVPDGSVSCGAELVSPPLAGAEGKRQVRLACEALNAAGATISTDTGLHVHHGVRDLNLGAFKRTAEFWATAQTVIDRLVSASRRGARSYTAPLTDRDIARIRNLTSLDAVNGVGINRYRTLNVTSYPLYGTVEVRQHQGTTNAAKMVAWIEFGQATIEAAKAAPSVDALDLSDLDAMLGTLTLHGGMSAETAAFLRRRADQLTSATERAEAARDAARRERRNRAYAVESF